MPRHCAVCFQLCRMHFKVSKFQIILEKPTRESLFRSKQTEAQAGQASNISRDDPNWTG